jgi:N-carbamoylputrescine amidase
MSIKLTVVQLQSKAYDPQHNRSRTLSAIEHAAAARAQLVILPELVSSGYGFDPDGLRQAAEPVEGPTFKTWFSAAKRLDLFIVGGICEIAGDRLYNSALLVGPDGIIGHYRKLHLFDQEKRIFTPGDRGLPVFDLPFAKIGICVCYDLRFVEVARALALQGADLIAVPTAWTGGFDRNPFDAMGFITQVRGVMVQANLNQIFLACASQPGIGNGLRFLGSSLITDPYGEPLAGPLGPDDEDTLTAEVDFSLAQAARVRSELIRPRSDRRTDIYGVTVGGQSY